MRPCILTAIAVLFASTVTAQSDDRLDGYNPVDLTTWQPRTARSAMALVEPLYRDHPYSSEGRPKLLVDLRKHESGGLVVDIMLRGYLDDSVDGEEYRGLISRTDAGWRLDALGRRNICARGANAGEPTTQLCP